jgi:hypothetical protein
MYDELPGDPYTSLALAALGAVILVEAAFYIHCLISGLSCSY